MGARDLSRWRRPLHAAMFVLLACVTLGTGSAARSDAASSSTVVGATVPSAISLDDTGCRTDGALELGTLTVNSWAITDPCTIAFGSSNDSARLRMWQRDQTAPALESIDADWTPRSGSTRWYDVAVGATAGTAWMSGVGGPGEPSVRLEHTTDGGATWAVLPTCAGRVASDLHALSDTLIYAVTSTTVCRSTDAGSTWTEVFSGSGLVRLDMVDASTGYLVGGNRIYRTSDGGTFTEVHASAAFSYLPTVSAHASGTVIAVGRTSALPDSTFGAVVSHDGGTTWVEHVLNVSAGLDTGGTHGALAYSDSVLLAGTPRGSWRSADGGATWNSMPIGATMSGEPFTRSDGTIVASTSGDSLRQSADGGATWTTLSLGTGYSTHNRAVAGQGLLELWVAGYDDRRLRSTDAGATWTAMSPAKPTWQAVVAWTPQRWAVGGEGGTVVRTSDAGATLTSGPLGSTMTMYDGIALEGGVGVLVGTSEIWRTTDHGASWTSISPPAAGGVWYEVAVDDENRLWIAGSGGRVGSSVDNGLTWALEASVPGAPTLTALDTWRGQVWVGAAAGQVWRASSSSASLVWTDVSTGRPATVISIWAIDASTAVVLTGYESATDAAYATRTADGGTTWSSASLPVRHPRDLAFDEARRFGWVTSSNAISRSTDRGLTWESTTSVGVSQYINRIATLNGGRLVAVGDGSLISVSTPRAGVPDGIGATGGGFGACLETATGTSVNHWSPAGTSNCSSANLAGWNAIASLPAGPTATLATTAVGGSGSLQLRFGMRAASNQAPVTYAANLVIEAVAPGV